MRARLWLLNVLLANMLEAFVLAYVIPNLSELGSAGILIILISMSITALIVSRLILGRDYGATITQKKNRKLLLLLLIAFVIILLGFGLNNMTVIIVGFVMLIPLAIINFLKRR